MKVKVRNILFSWVCELKRITGNLGADASVHMEKVKVKSESEKDIFLTGV